METPRTVSMLCEAINSHDPRRVAACFAEDYRCEIPLDPARSFTGSAQVLANWTALFTQIKGLHAGVLRAATTAEGETWSEWEMTGTTADGGVARLVGPVVWTEDGDRVRWARFYLDRVST